MAEWFRKPDTPPPPVLDDDYLTRLADHIGLEETRELLADGLLELSDRLDLLATLAAQEDIQRIATLCHDIAGASGHLGLSRLSHASVAACRICRLNPPPSAPEIVEDILSVRAESLNAANRFCQPPAADEAAGNDSE